ncbi:MAG: hypothetical protein IJ679_10190 [Lachnospiraceae bacterium]|nr:hypothetical protein [Lachnospiraceae bacterium]
MKTLYLHIGTAKTGTTSLQKFFAINRSLLQKKGFSFPEMPFGFEDVGQKNRNGHFLTLYDEPDTEKKWEKGWKTVRETFLKSNNVILSDEQIWIVQVKDGFWEKVLSEAEKAGVALKVIVYLRKQDEIAESHWNQKVKGRPKLSSTFFEFINEGGYDFFPLDYGKTIDHVASCIGKENLRVRAFERQQFAGGSLFVDFLQLLSLGLTDEYKMPGHVSNLRLPDNVVEIKRLINQVQSYQKESIPNFYWDAIRQAYGLGTMKEIPVAQKGMFSPEERAQYLDRFAEGNAHVAKEYLGRKDGTLFFGEASTLPKWEPDETEMLKDMVRVFAGADTYLFARQEELAAKLEEANRKLEEIYNSFPYRVVRKMHRGKREDG